MFQIKPLSAITALIISDKVILATSNDAVNLIGNCRYSGHDNIIILKEHVAEGFFDLKSKLAGDILQKFSTYQTKLAIVGDFSGHASNSLKNFIYESNKTGRIIFTGSVEEAQQVLERRG